LGWQSYPIELRLQGKTVLVVGLGQVGLGKAATLVEAKARVIGVDPAADVDPAELDGLEVRREPYHPKLLHEVSLAIAAGPPEINRRVVHDTRLAGVWVCSVSEPDQGDFILPAVWRSGPLVLTVSTSGASPALAALLRDRAAEALGPAAVGLAALLGELRPLVLERVSNPEARRRIFREWADPSWLALWSEHGSDKLRLALMQRIEDERP
jgi:siroheme synthase-like protein